MFCSVKLSIIGQVVSGFVPFGWVLLGIMS
nr:MAG TPA: hypothetical protein [Caudoviricetes sp.]